MWFGITLYITSLLFIPMIGITLADHVTAKTIGYSYITATVCLLLFAVLLKTFGPGEPDEWFQALIIIAVSYLPFAGFTFIAKDLYGGFTR